jgi:hypothetical protein
MIMKEKLCLIFLISLIGCKDPAEYFGRPKISMAINSECYGYREGSRVDTSNYICISPLDYDIIYQYCQDKELRLYKCLRYGRCD